MLFKDKVIWITGASSGIGAELAKQLSVQGAKLILTARNKAALTEASAACNGAASFILPADLTDASIIESLARQAIQAFGHIDVVMHAAGVSQRSLSRDTNMDVQRRLMEINYFAPIGITKVLLPHFETKGGGHIVVVSSMAGLMGFPLRTGYAAAKHALKGYFETLQAEHTVPGLHITLVYPGRIRTPISLSALTGDGTAHGRMDEGQLKGIPVEACASKIIHAMQHKKKRVIIAKGERILWWIWFLMPALYYRIARREGLET